MTRRALASLLVIVVLAGLEPATPQGVIYSAAARTQVPGGNPRTVRVRDSRGAVGEQVPGGNRAATLSSSSLIGPIYTASATSRQGTWAYANASHGPRYLAIPEGPGLLVTVCGPADCLDRVSIDAGPELWLQRKGRIGDLSSVDFERICGVPISAGLCPGSYTIVHRAATLPPTDVLVEVLGEGPRVTATLPPTDWRAP